MIPNKKHPLCFDSEGRKKKNAFVCIGRHGISQIRRLRLFLFCILHYSSYIWLDNTVESTPNLLSTPWNKVPMIFPCLWEYQTILLKKSVPESFKQWFLTLICQKLLLSLFHRARHNFVWWVYANQRNSDNDQWLNGDFVGLMRNKLACSSMQIHLITDLGKSVSLEQ